MGREHYVSPYDIATIQVGMGNRKQALESLRTAVEEHAFWVMAPASGSLGRSFMDQPRT
jgi:hypothetical protein